MDPTSSAANRVFGCRDLRHHIAQFLPWYSVNPLFGSLEGAILENRPELYGTPTYGILSDARIVRLIQYYVDTYEDHREISDFSTCLNYVFTRFGFQKPYMELFDRMTVDRSMERLLIKLIESSDRPYASRRILEFVEGILETGLEYSFGDLFQTWMQYSHRHGDHWSVLTESLELELNAIRNHYQEGEDPESIHSVEILDRGLRDSIRELTDLFTSPHRAEILMNIRMRPAYFYLNVVKSFSEPFAKLVQYASVNCVDIFAEHGVYTYLEDCVECIECLPFSELQVISQDDVVYVNLCTMLQSSLDFMRQEWMQSVDLEDDDYVHEPSLTDDERELAGRVSDQLRMLMAL